MTQPLVTPGQAIPHQWRHPLGMKGKSVWPRGGKTKGNLDPATFKSRFALQRVAAGLLAGERRETKNGKVRDRWPVCGCHRNAVGQVVRHTDTGFAVRFLRVERELEALVLGAAKEAEPESRD